jgi:acetylornithine aminotransferase
MSLFDVYPLNDITIIKGEGSYVWDNKETKYLDLYGGHAVISIGHSHRHYVSRLKEQLDNIGFYSNSIIIPQQRELADRLINISGKNKYQLFLCNSGAEANENALKLASFHTGRRQVVAFSKAFHGRTSLAVAATDNASIVAPVNETGNVTFLPFNDVAALVEHFTNHGNEIAAVITEGIQGVGGIHVASDEFLQNIRSLCDQYGAVFIADSVQDGYGRTGKFFAHDHAGVNADIYSMAKGMGNGFPIGGILIAPHIRPKHGMLGTTFGGNHLACAAALAVLDVIDNERLMAHAGKMGDYIMDELRRIPQLQNVRGRGLMIGFDVPAEMKDLKSKLLWEQHIFTGEAKPNVIRLLPALNLQQKEADMFITATKAVIAHYPTLANA